MTTRDYQERSAMRIYLSYFKPHWKLLCVDMACAFTVALIDLAFPFVSRWCIYELLPVNAYRTFFAVMVALLAAFAFRAGLNFIIGYWGHTFGIRVEADVRRDLFRHLEEMSFSFYDQNRTGQLMSRLTTDLFEITELSHHGPEDLFISCTTIVGALIIMFTIQWRLAIVIACILPVFVAAVWACRRSMGAASREVKASTGRINTDIESSISGLRTTKAFANETIEQQKFDAINQVYKYSKRSFHKAMGRFNATMEFFLCALQGVVIAVGGYEIMKGNMTVVDLITFNLYVAAFINPMRRLSNFAELLTNGTAGLQRFMELMRRSAELEDAPDAKVLTGIRGDIQLDHVGFCYRDDLEVLHDVDLQIRAGETVALVGPSGGGKSTICQLIPRFYDVTDGAIRVDGTDVREVTQDSLRRSIGIVQQEVFLFADTVLENIRYGRPDATDEEVAQAAKLAEIYDDIMAMPDGFSTYVGERGARLSGGQKQRISIARIFLKDPAVVILDEATSALDSVTEARLQKTFDKLTEGRTTLVIAHRLSTVRNANRIAFVENGTIREMGTHEELMTRNGAYAGLVRAQELKS